MTVRVNLIASSSNPIDLDMSLEKDEHIDLKSALSIVPNAGDYEQLSNKPKIEGHTLIGNSTLPEINVHEMTAAQAASLLN